MSSNATHEFPSPIGGVPYSIDFAPSILFSVLHALLIPICIWRMARSRTRTFVLIGVSIFNIERTIFYALRAYASQRVGSRESIGLEVYFQGTLASGYVTLGQDLTSLARALFVNATKSSDVLAREAKANKNNKPDCGSDAASDLDTILPEDRSKARKFIRRAAFGAALLFWAAMIMGIVATVVYPEVLKTGALADVARGLWKTNAILAIVLLVGLSNGAIWAYYALPRVPRNPTIWIVFIAALVSIVPIYRMYVLRFSTTSLLPDAPRSLNSAQSKATFYVFHSAPEFLAAAILALLDARQVFNTGLWGDRRMRDPERKA